MDDAERAVAVLAVVHEDAKPDDVIDLVDRPAFGQHLTVDRVDVLRAAGDLRFDTGVPQRLQKLGLDLCDEWGRVTGSLVEFTGQCVDMPRGLRTAEGEIFELGFELPDAESVRQWRVDLQGLLSDARSVSRAAGRRACACCAGGRLA